MFIEENFEKRQKVSDYLRTYCRSLLEYAYNNMETANWIISNQDKTGDLAKRFQDVHKGLQGEFTKAYAESIGMGYIVEFIKDTLEKLVRNRFKTYDHLNMDLDMVLCKLDSLTKDTNNVTSQLMIDRVKSNKVYREYSAKNIRTNFKSLSKLIEESINPEKDLANIPSTLSNILITAYSALKDYISSYNARIKNIEIGTKSGSKDVEVGSIKDGINTNIIGLDLTTKKLEPNDVMEAIKKALFDNPNVPNKNADIIESIDVLIKSYDNLLIKGCIDYCNNVKSLFSVLLEKGNAQLTYDVKGNIENAVAGYSNQSITNEEYMKTIDTYTTLLDRSIPLDKEFYLMLENIIIIGSVVIDCVLDSYGAIYKGFKFAECAE